MLLKINPANFILPTYSLINTDEMLAKSLDIGNLLLNWKLELATETTPDLQVVINANPCGNSQRNTCSVRLDSLKLRSFVLKLTK